MICLLAQMSTDPEEGKNQKRKFPIDSWQRVSTPRLTIQPGSDYEPDIVPIANDPKAVFHIVPILMSMPG